MNLERLKITAKERNYADRMFETLETCWEGIMRTREISVHTNGIKKKFDEYYNKLDSLCSKRCWYLFIS